MTMNDAPATQRSSFVGRLMLQLGFRAEATDDNRDVGPTEVAGLPGTSE
jgi:hypothetical protein